VGATAGSLELAVQLQIHPLQDAERIVPVAPARTAWRPSARLSKKLGGEK